MADRPHKRHGYSSFQHDWGCHVLDLAAEEGCTTEAIYQRAYRFGSPYQRKAKPTMIEKYYGKTQAELAEELGMHPITCLQKHKKNGTAYHKKKLTDQMKGWTCTDFSWKTNPKFNAKPWLHPHHPDYDAWRRGELFPECHIEKPKDY